MLLPVNQTMKEKSKQPIILLVGEYGKENGFIKNWLESNNFSTREAVDVFEVLDEISDFTVRECPDIFMLQVKSQAADFDKINDLVQTFSDSSDILVASVSSKDGFINEKNNEKNISHRFSGVEANLNALLPALSRSAVGGDL